jgi:hypothetical protein
MFQQHPVRTAVVVVLVSLFAGAALAKSKHGGGRGNGGGKCDNPCTQPTVRPCESEITEPVNFERGSRSKLTDVERNSLLAMRREEKLAHDVYVALGAKFNQRIFTKISGSELRHQEMVAGLLDKYGVANPVRNLPAGKFDDPAVQALHDQFVARGSVSLQAALQVGVDIETMDIADLQAALKVVKKTDIISVYENLLAGSQNHLAAFQRVLAAQKR